MEHFVEVKSYWLIEIMIHRRRPHILICLKYNEKIKLKFTLDYARRIKKMAENLMVLRESSILGEFILFTK